MINSIKKKLYFLKVQLLSSKGFQEGKIVPFDEDFYSKMKDTLINNIPVSIHIKYLKPVIPPGKCYDRSLYMFFCFKDSLLVRGNNKNLEYNFGKENAKHGWIELDNYVYDPSLLLRFDKDLYYQIYSPTNITKISKNEYNNINNGYYDEITSVNREDLKPGGKKRYELAVTIPLIKKIADMKDNEEFKNELEEYLSSICYDEQQVYEELNQGISYVMSKR